MRAVAWRSLKRRRLRTLFTGAAIALGVANVFGVFVTNDSMRVAVERRARAATGGADVIARAEGRPWLRDDDVRRMQSLSGIRKTIRWSYYLRLASKGRSEVYMQAVDVAAMSELVTVRDGRLPTSGEPEIALTRTAARELGADIGDEVRELVPKKTHRQPPRGDTEFVTERSTKGPITFTVTAIADTFPSLSPDANYGSFTSNEFMWTIVRPKAVVEMAFLLDDDVDPQDWTSETGVLLPNVQFESSAGSPFLRDFLRSFRALLTGTAALALVIGAFLVYLVFTLAIAERTRLVGLLHSVGASPRQVAAVVLREALMLGTSSTAVGLLIGLALGAGLLSLVSAISGLGIRASLHIALGPFIAAALVGIVATLVGAAIPAVRAARMTPVEAVTGRTRLARRPRAWMVGLPAFGAGCATIAVRGLSSDVVSQVAITGVLLGAVFAVPLGVGLLARVFTPVVTRLVPGSGMIVLRHLTREPGRSAYTLALVMLVLASVVALTSSARSLHENSRRIVDARFGADLILYGNDVGELTDDVRDLDGISGSTPIDFGRRIGLVAKGRETSNLVLVDPNGFFDIAGFPWRDGTDRDARAALRDGGAVLLPSPLAKRHDLELGERVRLRSSTSERTYTVAAIYSFGGTGPEIGIVGSLRDDFLAADESTQSAVYMNFDDGTERQEILDRLLPVLREHGELAARDQWKHRESNDFGVAVGPYFALAGAEIKAQAKEELDGYIRLFSAVIGVIVVAGALGMATALATSVVLRTRELGTIEAVGGTPSHVRRMVLAESLLLTATAYVLAVGLGFVIAWLFITGITEMTGSYVPVRFAWRALPYVAVLALAIASAAAYVPTRRAMRITPVEALRYE